ncbi:MAG: hypothetical protein U5O39_17175 [Gammaproteobacteria bacterium]|nr:hypothetical protein [Gammaproteobacteria bacterium]
MPAHSSSGWKNPARVAGVANIDLEVRSDNKEAMEFYASLGYQVGKTLEGYYRGREDAVTTVHQLIEPDFAAKRPE